MASQSHLKNEALYEYLVSRSLREPEILRDLRAETDKLLQGHWRTPPEQAQFMALLAQISGARLYLELGTFTGYGTLSMAIALSDPAKIITCDLDDEFPSVGRPYWERAGVADKIDLRLMPAGDLMQSLLSSNHGGSFDMIYVDADKENYVDYYRYSKDLLKLGGLLLIDNVLWSGAVIDPGNQKRSTRAIRQTNDLVFSDQSLDISIVPIGDGLTIARKIS